MPEGMEATRPAEAWVEVTNQGNGPAVIEKLLFLGGVPNPTAETGSAPEEESVSGIFDEEFGAGEVDSIVVLPENSRLLFTITQPFLFGGTTRECPTSPTQEQFEVVLTSRPGGNVSKQYDVEYGAERGDGDCNVTIVGEA
jgi:hypothetical protein